MTFRRGQLFTGLRVRVLLVTLLVLAAPPLQGNPPLPFDSQTHLRTAKHEAVTTKHRKPPKPKSKVKAERFEVRCPDCGCCFTNAPKTVLTNGARTVFKDNVAVGNTLEQTLYFNCRKCHQEFTAQNEKFKPLVKARPVE